MKSNNIAQLNAPISELSIQELENVYGNMSDENKASLTRIAKARKWCISDAVRWALKYSDPDQSDPSTLSQSFYRRQMNNVNETSVPRFSRSLM